MLAFAVFDLKWSRVSTSNTFNNIWIITVDKIGQYWSGNVDTKSNFNWFMYNGTWLT